MFRRKVAWFKCGWFPLNVIFKSSFPGCHTEGELCKVHGKVIERGLWRGITHCIPQRNSVYISQVPVQTWINLICNQRSVVSVNITWHTITLVVVVVVIKFIVLIEPYGLWKTVRFMSISSDSVPKYMFWSFESRIVRIQDPRIPFSSPHSTYLRRAFG